MKKSRKCPKCGSSDLFHRAARKISHRSAEAGRTEFSSQTPEMYVCRNCGIVEEYFTAQQIQKIEAWEVRR